MKLIEFEYLQILYLFYSTETTGYSTLHRSESNLTVRTNQTKPRN
jgi:hypothetical protein